MPDTPDAEQVAQSQFWALPCPQLRAPQEGLVLTAKGAGNTTLWPKPMQGEPQPVHQVLGNMLAQPGRTEWTSSPASLSPTAPLSLAAGGGLRFRSLRKCSRSPGKTEIVFLKHQLSGGLWGRLGKAG